MHKILPPETDFHPGRQSAYEIGFLFSTNDFTNRIVSKIKHHYRVTIRPYTNPFRKDHTLDLILCDKSNVLLHQKMNGHPKTDSKSFLLVEENDAVPAKYLIDPTIDDILVVSKTLDNLVSGLNYKVKQLADRQHTNSSDTATLHRKDESGLLPLLDQAIAVKAPMNQLTIPVLAKAIGVTSKSLCKQIKKETGLCAVQYILKKRLVLAATLLRRTEVSVQQAAIETGFMSDSYFSKTFKKKFGVSPSNYKLCT